MKKAVLTILLTGTFAMLKAQYPVITIDSLQFMNANRLSQVKFGVAGQDGTLPDYVSPVMKNPVFGDTVTIEGIVSYDPISYGLSTTKSRQAAFLQSENGGPWSGVEVMFDSAVQYAEQNVVLFKQNMKKGRKVRVTGRIRDFQGETQLTVINVPTQVLSLTPVNIVPEDVLISDFSKDIAGQQVPQFVTGEPYEGVYVEFKNVTVVRDPGSLQNNLPRYTWWVQDANGNRISIRDVSGYFRNDNFDEDPNTPTPFNPPPQGSNISYIRGVIVESGNNSFKIYSLAPLLPSDVGVVIQPPSITNVTRTPALVRSSNTVTFTAKITDLGSVAEAHLNYAVGYSNNTFVKIPMTLSGVDVFTAQIPAQANGSVVKYFISAKDDGGYMAYFPDSTGNNSAYKVIDDLNSISQIQETPLPNGASMFTNDTLSGLNIKALVVATINDYDLGITTIQSNTEAWGTIFVRFTSGDGINEWKRGDSVLIKKAVVTERIPLSSNPFGRLSTSGVTFLENIGSDGWEYLGRCIELPATAKVPFDSLMSTTFNKEPYESMLLELNNVYVVQKNADSVTGGFFGEFAVNPNVMAPTGLRADDYSNDLYVNRVSDSLNRNGLDFLPVFKGVLVNTFGNWKFYPRNRTDMSKAGNLVPPYLTLIGADTLFVPRGGNINDPGASACDDEDGDISTSVVIDSTQVNKNVSGTYQSYYTAEDAAGNQSDEISRVIVITPAMSVSEAESVSVALFPVPATSQLNVRLSSSFENQANIRILDMNGKVIMEKVIAVGSGNNFYQLDLSSFSTGAYICQISSNAYVLTEKITVIR